MSKQNSSIKWELTFFIVVLLVVVIGALSYFVLDSQKKSLTNEVKLRGLSVARNLANNIADPMLTDDELSIARLLSDTMNNKGVKYAEVVDKKNVIKAHNNLEEMGSKYAAPETIEELEAAPYRIALFADKDKVKVLDFAVPVIAKGKLDLGTAHLGIAYSVVEDVLRRAFVNVAVVSIIAVLLGIIGAFVLGITITQPINVLAKGAKIIGSGNLDYKIKVKSSNELGALAGVFNMMTQDLKRVQDVMVKQQRLERELEVAKEIQLSLIPKDIAKISGYEIAAYYSPAKEVSGDYYDVMPLGEGKYGFVVADVSGKGVPAALIMTMARSIIHSEAKAGISSEDVMKKLNQIIFPDLREGMFITVYYGILDSMRGMIDMASAGHNNAYVYKPAEKEVLLYNPKGFPIGMDPGPRFNKVVKSETVKVEKGDVVVAYTDGITEAMNPSKQEYGEPRFIELIKAHGSGSAQEIADALTADVTAFVNGAEQSDDISLVILKRK